MRGTAGGWQQEQCMEMLGEGGNLIPLPPSFKFVPFWGPVGRSEHGHAAWLG